MATMKLWFEYPDSTKFARNAFDILYTPIFFANEGVSGHLCFEVSESHAAAILHCTAEVSLTGTASLGLLNIGGRPANIYDSRYAFSTVGFRPIVTVPLYDNYDTLPMDAGPYERSGVVGRRIPFSFNLPAHSSNEIKEWSPSLKIISSDTETSLDILKSSTPTMLLNVRYILQGVLHQFIDGQSVEVRKFEQDVRVFVSLDSHQTPDILPDIADSVTQYRRQSLFGLKESRRASLFSRGGNSRKSVHEGGNHVIVEADDPEPLVFQTHSDAAATKVKLTLTYSGDGSSESPGPVAAAIEWSLRSLSSVAVQPANRPEGSEPTDDAFHLRTRHLPARKLKMSWNTWRRPAEDEDTSGGTAWRAEADLWLTQPVTSGLAPTFRTSFLSHSYALSLSATLTGKGLRGKSYKVDLNVPVKVRYDVGLAPGYTVDPSLPGYSVDEGTYTEQAGPPPEMPNDMRDDPPPPDDLPDYHARPTNQLRLTPDELSELMRQSRLNAERGGTMPVQRAMTTAQEHRTLEHLRGM